MCLAEKWNIRFVGRAIAMPPAAKDQICGNSGDLGGRRNEKHFTVRFFARQPLKILQIRLKIYRSNASGMN
jgi:hypothetical protein